MKLLLLVGLYFLSSTLLFAQESNRAIHVSLNPTPKSIYDSLFYVNDWRKEYARNVNADSLFGKDWMGKILKVGNAVPDLELKMSIKGVVRKLRFSDFRNKILILDFWSTFCSSCIESFPKMKHLQERFGDKIQIVLVNPFETEEQVKARIGKNITKMPDLPLVFGATYLFPYFPMRWVPYHVWIDQKGEVVVLGSNFNTYEKKIDALVKGRKISSWQDECTKPSFNKEISYAKLLGIKPKATSYNSFFTFFNNEYAPKGSTLGSSVVNKIDSTNNARRSTFVNWTIEELYRYAFESMYQNPLNRKIFINPYDSSLLDEVKDSLRYSYRYSQFPVDTTFTKSMFCYEQIVPESISIEQSQHMMAEDLNAYFGKLYGTYGRVEKRIVPAFVIVKTSGNKSRRLFSKTKPYSKEIIKNGQKWVQHRGISFEGALGGVLQIHLLNDRTPLINETGIDGKAKINIELPVKATIVNIKQALKPFGLDIIKRNTEVDLLLISDTKAK
ncbi:TlpA family protein disulfide reductase [Pedobacter africanus]|uniref:Thiol-disulfide isomerase or thioredoxin n=1 Tax=Pedobacter africanus TaxID=151894 RepID=A0A1W2CUU2_9SPHI|nr:TlpA disulfide reductase family protein [Pedobacter africanus]SMC88662.1 Thiol-disulfide isomerase or thioredoxin [Pedobacter africanus]